MAFSHKLFPHFRKQSLKKWAMIINVYDHTIHFGFKCGSTRLTKDISANGNFNQFSQWISVFVSTTQRFRIFFRLVCRKKNKKLKHQIGIIEECFFKRICFVCVIFRWGEKHKEQMFFVVYVFNKVMSWSKFVRGLKWFMCFRWQRCKCEKLACFFFFFFVQVNKKMCRNYWGIHFVQLSLINQSECTRRNCSLFLALFLWNLSATWVLFIALSFRYTATNSFVAERHGIVEN